MTTWPVLLATPAPSPGPAVPDADRVTPGTAGFLVVFLLALATVLLVRSMTGHLRKVRYSPDPAAEASTRPAAQQSAEASTQPAAQQSAEPSAGTVGEEDPGPTGRPGGSP